MRVVHYQPQLMSFESGTGNAGRGWCEALVRQGVEVTGLFDEAASRRASPEGTEAIAVKHVLSGPLQVPRGVAEYIAGADAVVLHGGWLLSNVAVGFASVRAGVPFVVTTHGVYMPEVMRRKALTKRVWAYFLERPHLKRALAVHAFFSEESERVRHMTGDTPTIVAPNGIDIPDGVAWDGGSGGYLLWLGRFDPTTKGLDLLLRAIQSISVDRRPVVRLHGPDWRNSKEGIRRLANELGIARWVIIAEPIYGDDKWDAMTKAVACVYPFRWDACSVAVAEAAAAGVPTLVTRYPLGNFLAAKSAVIQTDAEVSAIADGLLRVMSSEGATVGGNAARVAREHLVWDVVARSWLNQLTSLLGSVQDPLSGR